VLDSLVPWQQAATGDPRAVLYWTYHLGRHLFFATQVRTSYYVQHVLYRVCNLTCGVACIQTLVTNDTSSEL
jgi:hypothetical protein